MPTFREAFDDAFRKAKETKPHLTIAEFQRMAWDAKANVAVQLERYFES
jgi:hypothetical protein